MKRQLHCQRAHSFLFCFSSNNVARKTKKFLIHFAPCLPCSATHSHRFRCVYVCAVCPQIFDVRANVIVCRNRCTICPCGSVCIDSCLLHVRPYIRNALCDVQCMRPLFKSFFFIHILHAIIPNVRSDDACDAVVVLNTSIFIY